jgi:CheY-like chemotaxis protein
MQVILFVLEDDERQIAAIRHVIKMDFPSCDLRLAQDGQAAIDILLGERLQPDIAILDINTPRLNGLEVLARIRQIPQFAYLPIVMFTTSDSEVDRQRAMGLGATDYVIKPPIRLMGSELRRIVDRHSAQVVKPVADWQDAAPQESTGALHDHSAWDDIDSLLEGL